MSHIVLTKTGGILGPFASLLGYLINIIYVGFSKIGINNVAISIIGFTVLVYMLLLPMTIKQQKFSKLNAMISPEIKAIQKKYKGKRDQQSLMMQQEEQKALYAKYGISQTGGCLQMLIQLPILFSMIQVINNIPAYVPAVKEVYNGLATKMMAISGSKDIIFKMAETINLRGYKNMDFSKVDYVIDFLNGLKPENWATLKDQMPSITDAIGSTEKTVEGINNFFGINIASTSFNLLTEGFAKGAVVAILIGILIPVLNGVFSWLSTHLMMKSTTAASSNNGEDVTDQMANSMKTMNNIMPIISVVFTFIYQVGFGLYWLFSSIVRLIQQIIINKHLDKMDLNEILEKNKEKYEAHLAKQRPRNIPSAENINKNARENIRNIRADQIQYDSSRSSESVKEGSLASKARMVEDYNHRGKEES